MLVDCHTHVACPDRQRFPRTRTGVGSDWSHHGGSVEELLAGMDATGVERAVVVQAIGVYAHDCACAADAVAAHPGRLALVGSVDMDDPDPAAALAALAAGAPLAGVRLFGVGDADPSWLTDGRGHAVLEAAAELGTTVVPTIFSDRLGDLGALLERHPSVPVALDHCAFPDRDPDGAETALVALAELPSLWLKVTSYVLEGAERDEGDPAPMLERLVAAFDADRLCWGSDHPQDRRHDYAGKLDLVRRAARGLDEAQRDALLGRSALGLWWP